ncbi:MAG: FIST C-terminal domain-containing protein [Rhodocyclaceae bacterium]|nr:FIST C-terminal domain-containing protein [Rhodocyclaceae bacterium]MBX3668121.1 FIST C-terminal domain-containing protein [Rhodocyclaceae bacterium]
MTLSTYRIGTGLARGDEPEPQVAAAAVAAALDRAGLDSAHSVLLLLSSEFARSAHAAVTAAARAAGAVNVQGCTVPGVFTEQDWALDMPAAAALVLGGDLRLGPPADGPALSFATPCAAPAVWLASRPERLGALSTHADGQHGGRVFAHGQLHDSGAVEFGVRGARAVYAVSRGVRMLGGGHRVSGAGELELFALDGHAALGTLQRELPLELRELRQDALHHLFAGVARDAAAAAGGDYRLLPVLRANGDDRSVTLGGRVEVGEHLFWCARQAVAAEGDMRHAAAKAAAAMDGSARFGLVFSCLGRGPYFYGGEDRDLAAIRDRLPGLPLVGAYCAGEIAPVGGQNVLLHNSVVLALFGEGA